MSGDYSDAQAAFGRQPPRKPASSLGYWIAAMIAFAAVAGAIAWFVVGLTGLDDRVSELHRLTVPGELTAELGAGKHAVYWEGRGDPPAMDIAVRRVDGPEVPVGPHGGEVTYDVGGHAGTSVAGFTTPEAGRYVLRVDSRRPGVVAFGEGVGGRIVSAVVGGLGIFFGGLLLCGLAIIITARRRRS